MSRAPRSIAPAEIHRLARVKSFQPPAAAALGEHMIDFFKQSVVRRQTKLAAIAQAWVSLVPPMFSDHCALDSYTRGALTVMVDSAAHLYELRQLLLAGLQDQLLLACKSTGLRKISLRPGRWYHGDGPADRRVRFVSGT
jgi:Dna[CI] antecedent, DciA